jgi:hypothetical protein
MGSMARFVSLYGLDHGPCFKNTLARLYGAHSLPPPPAPIDTVLIHGAGGGGKLDAWRAAGGSIRWGVVHHRSTTNTSPPAARKGQPGRALVRIRSVPFTV